MHLLIRLSIVAVVALGVAAQSWAQTWPHKPIRTLMNVPPGSAVDVIVRIFSAPLGEALGQPLLLDYRAGGAGNIGVEAVVKSAPDGYTLLASAGGTMVINSHLYKLNFDMGADLEPVAATARPSIFLVVRAGLPVRSVAELIAYARANPGKLNFGSPGSGTGLHIAAEMMLRMAKVQATHVTYKGAAQMLTDLLGNQIDFMFDPGPAIPHIKSGKLRLLAAANTARHRGALEPRDRAHHAHARGARRAHAHCRRAGHRFARGVRRASAPRARALRRGGARSQYPRRMSRRANYCARLRRD